MNEMLDQFMSAVFLHAPRVLAALAILVVGWILAHLLSGGLLAPMENMVQALVGFLPHLLAAVIIFAVGWFVARIVQRVVTGLLAAAGAQV